MSFSRTLNGLLKTQLSFSKLVQKALEVSSVSLAPHQISNIDNEREADGSSKQDSRPVHYYQFILVRKPDEKLNRVILQSYLLVPEKLGSAWSLIVANNSAAALRKSRTMKSEKAIECAEEGKLVVGLSDQARRQRDEEPRLERAGRLSDGEERSRNLAEQQRRRASRRSATASGHAAPSQGSCFPVE